MILRANECRARAREAIELARHTKRVSTKTALEQAAEYWVGLAERVEQQRGRPVLHLPSSVGAHTDSMPVLSYVVSVGIALFFGLLVASAQLQPREPDHGAVSKAQTNAALSPKNGPAFGE
jgi:hypothetical protein